MRFKFLILVLCHYDVYIPTYFHILGASDNTIQLWNAQTGDRISMLDLHAQILSVSVSFNLTYVVVQLAKSSSVPILKHHNNPAKGITLDMLPGQKEERENLGNYFTKYYLFVLQ